MSFFQDMFSIFKKRELAFLESYKESEDVYSFLFKKENDVTWKAGQYGLFIITHRKVKNSTKPFSIASAPLEDVVRITTRISDQPSDYKKALLELKQGMKIKMGGPVGSFHLDHTKPSLLIAGGIGITPFRAMLKQMAAAGNKGGQPIQLLYLDSNKSYLYKDELDALANQLSFKVTYLDSRDELEQEMNQYINLHKDKANYLIAGPKSIVDSLSSTIKQNNIPKRNIQKDAFFGY
ncbi:FAD-dependent oxidoreductase [Paenibacillus sp. 1P07SE]|uniref:FAD-dependent oxidoreductase n=1 Tax=Paenibacillus sp. 1P07SE TaxID=3132209 RepID=UPI0039A5BE01